MKDLIRGMFSIVLLRLESGDEPYVYKPSHRKILTIMGFLFSCLATLVFFLGRGEEIGYLFPVVIFGLLGVLSIVVSLVGSDRAVSKIWGSK